MRKRFLDLFMTIPAFLFSAPVMVLIAFLIRLSMGRPIIFRQIRPGLNGKPFRIYKFRTMKDVFDKNGYALPDKVRLTRLGKILRSTSLDELPELFNVLKGNMSIIGPRPLLPKYMPYFTEREMTRFSCLPGITGWAQVNGRNALAWDKRLALDVWYVENWSLLLDVHILLRTVVLTLTRKGVITDPRSNMLDLDEERKGFHEGGKNG